MHGPVNLVRLAQLIDLVDAPHLLFPPYKPSYPTQLVPGRSFFEQMKRKDILIHQPFESFEGVLGFLREAVYDPKVLAIKQTIYRTGTESELVDLLREAVRRGKEVSAVVELKARFDEEVNINWAESLEAIGAQVVYGVVGLKTHAKMLLVTRREGKQLIRYAHLSTGNYNPHTAKLYTDLERPHRRPEDDGGHRKRFLPPCKPQQAAAIAPTLAGAVSPAAQADRSHRRAGRSGGPETRGPHHSEDERVDRPAADAGAGSRRAAGREDRPHRPRRLHAAGAVAGVTDNIKVRSVIGRFLEHSRVFYFRLDGEETALPVQRRLDEPQYAAPRRAGLAGDRCQPAPADRGRVPGGLPAGRPGRLGPDAGRALQTRQGAGEPKGHGAQDALMARYTAPDGQEGGNMDLILWRHAEAQDEDESGDDLQRSLTGRGEKQAARMAVWLDQHLPEGTRILCSPALRCEQTVLPLGRKYKLREELAPGQDSSLLLDAAGWPDARQATSRGRPPAVLGQVVARLIGLKQDTCPVRKGAVWWLRTRERDGQQQTVVVAVQSPDVLSWRDMPVAGCTCHAGLRRHPRGCRVTPRMTETDWRSRRSRCRPTTTG